MRRVVSLCALLVVLVGCSMTSNRIQSALAPAVNMPSGLFCEGACRDEWTRAQLWIANHAQWRIELATEAVIRTAHPLTSDPSYSFSVTKEPRSGGAMIRLTMACGNLYGCDPTQDDVGRAFYYYVKTGTDLLVGQGYLSAIR